ncbi:hypothetical protein [Allokutzneria albata]|uniref:Uncharacterized protein n=1 Tax=Allokutzneria albata TaxID=211114 RepID=A0A1G9SYV2_ALLAB|nr:hypothetical protein [Allokutzneria albata]SDM40618.1 hypothetical protein SAMN04489726_1461 [Allokutzneria albata]
MLTSLTAVFALAPVGCWLLLARTERQRWRVALGLAVLAGLSFPVLAGIAFAGIDRVVWLGYVPLTALVILFARRAEGWVAPRSRRALAGRIALGLFLGPVWLLVVVGWWIAETEPAPPSVAEVLPLPAGVAVVDARRTGCGSSYCGRTVVVVGPAGESTVDTMRRIREHLLGTKGFHDAGPNSVSKQHRLGFGGRDLSVDMSEQDGRILLQVGDGTNARG